jgi:hypothetical protein
LLFTLFATKSDGTTVGDEAMPSGSRMMLMGMLQYVLLGHAFEANVWRVSDVTMLTQFTNHIPQEQQHERDTSTTMIDVDTINNRRRKKRRKKEKGGTAYANKCLIRWPSPSARIQRASTDGTPQ